MIIIQTAAGASVNPFFPLLAKRHRPVRVVPWARYRKTLIPFTAIGGCLFSYGIALTLPEFYSEARFEFFAFANLCFSFVRTMRFRKTTNLYVEPDLALQRISLWADLDFALCFSSFGLGCFLVAIHNGAGYLEIAVLLGVICILFALIPAFNSATVYLRKLLSARS